LHFFVAGKLAQLELSEQSFRSCGAPPVPAGTPPVPWVLVLPPTPTTDPPDVAVVAPAVLDVPPVPRGMTLPASAGAGTL